MRRRALLALVLGCAAALGAAVVLAAADERELAFTLDVRPAGAVAVLEPGDEVCQRGVPVPAAFDVVELLVGTYGRPGPALAVTVRRLGPAATAARERGRVVAATGPPAARGTLAVGAADNRGARVRVTPRVGRGRPVDVCVRNAGDRLAALYGAPDREVPGTVGERGGRPLDSDLRLRFLRAEPRSALSLLPDMLERAALFRPRIVGVPTLWLVLVAMGVGAPLLLGLALSRATVTEVSRTRYAPEDGRAAEGSGFATPPGRG